MSVRIIYDSSSGDEAIVEIEAKNFADALNLLHECMSNKQVLRSSYKWATVRYNPKEKLKLIFSGNERDLRIFGITCENGFDITGIVTCLTILGFRLYDEHFNALFDDVKDFNCDLTTVNHVYHL